nr:unnamed protein product [Callosobruchus analis]
MSRLPVFHNLTGLRQCHAISSQRAKAMPGHRPYRTSAKQRNGSSNTYPEIQFLKSKTSSVIIEHLSQIFMRRVRKAKQCDIQSGDKVLTLNTATSDKLESKFLNEEFEVIERKGNEITIKSNGKTCKRHISYHIKPNQDRNISLTIPISVQQEENTITDQTTTEDDANIYQHEEDQVPTAKVEPVRLEKKEGLWRPALRELRRQARTVNLRG